MRRKGWVPAGAVVLIAAVVGGGVLVLSGGGARAYAHVGAVRALRRP